MNWMSKWVGEYVLIQAKGEKIRPTSTCNRRIWPEWMDMSDYQNKYLKAVLWMYVWRPGESKEMPVTNKTEGKYTFSHSWHGKIVWVTHILTSHMVVCIVQLGRKKMQALNTNKMWHMFKWWHREDSFTLPSPSKRVCKIENQNSKPPTIISIDSHETDITNAAVQRSSRTVDLAYSAYVAGWQICPLQLEIICFYGCVAFWRVIKTNECKN